MTTSLTQRRTDEASREVLATPDAVYAAFADPDRLIAWLPPGDMTGRVLEYDFRQDGRYSIELTYRSGPPSRVGKTSAKSDVTRGRFLALIRGKLISQSVEFDSSDPRFAGEMTMTWSLKRTTTGTLVTVKAQSVPPGISREDHLTGLQGSLENLASFLCEAPHH